MNFWKMMKTKDGCDKTDCKYRSTNRGLFVSCDYILFEGKSRGCKAGNDCDKYCPGQRGSLYIKNFKFIQGRYDD